MNDTKYFKHDCNSRTDQKIIKIRKKYGARGYGIYFMIIEIMSSHKEYTIEYDLNTLVYDLQEDEEIVKSIINDFGLFVVKKKVFYSPSLKRRMKQLDDMKEARSKGGQNRWKKKAKRAPGYTPEEAERLGLH